MLPTALIPLGLDEPLFLEPVESVGHRAEHQACRQRRTVADRGPDLVVELQQRHPVEPQPLQALLQAALDGARDIGQIAALEPHLGGDVGPRRQRREMAPDGLFRGCHCRKAAPCRSN